MDKIAILVPCYNEEKTITDVIKGFHQVMLETVIYVYDNNSSDRTAQLAEEAGAIVRCEYQQGKGVVSYPSPYTGYSCGRTVDRK